jgi:flagellar basal-body rod protein FlgG
VPEDASDIAIAPTGIVTVRSSGSTQPVEIGRLELARFLNPTGLLSIGENLMVQTEASGEPVEGYPLDEGFGRLMQGALEASNVEIVQEMTDMIAAQRAYEINARAIRAAEDMAYEINDLIR